MSDNKIKKIELRQRLIRERDAQTEAARHIKSKNIRDQILALPKFRSADSVFYYMSFGSEVKTDNIPNLGFGKTFAVPKTFPGSKMKFLAVDGTTRFNRSRFGIQEPESGMIIEPSESSIMIVPGVGFDEDCSRLGYGGGFYDRYFAEMHTSGRSGFLKVGVCFDCQMADGLPSEPTDIKMDIVVTESRVIFRT